MYSGRHRNYGDLRYAPTSDLHSSYRSPYSNTSPRYRSNYGSYSDFPREPYTSYSTLNGSLYSDGGSMSKYTRSYDITNRNHDITPKSYDSQRLFDRGRSDLDRSSEYTPPFEFGVSYTSPRTHDTSTRNHDISTKSYDRDTRNDDVTIRRSPARTSSLSDRDWNKPAGGSDAPSDLPPRPPGRQRLDSGDSSSSHSSERSGTTADDRSLFSALKNRYKETAERQGDDPGARTPFSSWRRSGHFEDVTSSKPHDGGEGREKSHSRLDKNEPSEKSHKTDGNFPSKDKYLSKRDSHREDRSNVNKIHPESSDSNIQQTEGNADDLIVNFRKALRRHALSENEKGDLKQRSPEVTRDTGISQPDDDNTAARLERLRSHRAKIQEQRKSEKVKSESFASEYKTEKDQSNKQRPGSASTLPTQKFERSERLVSDNVFNEDDEIKAKDSSQRSSTKLARQKLVSDDLKAKFMESRKDDKETSDAKEEVLARKRSSRKNKHKEHMEYWKKEKESENKSKVETGNIPTAEEMLLGSTKQSDKSPLAVRKHFENVDHSSPFGLVYTSKPSVSSSSSLKSKSSTKLENEKEKSKNEKTVIDYNEAKEPHKETPVTTREEPKQDKSRKYKKYAKANSLELGALSKKDESPEPTVKVESQDDSAIPLTMDELSQLSRKDRIAKYKEERKKQLATISNRFSGADSEMPSLFLSSKTDTDSSLLRSKSLKVESDGKSDLSPSSVSRSKSLKQDKESPDFSPASRIVPKISGLQLAEIGSQSNADTEKDVYNTEDQIYNTDKIIDKLHALKKLKDEHLKKSGLTIEDLQAKRSSKEDKDLSDHSRLSSEEPVSYASKTLLADRVMEDSGGKYGSKHRERILSSERNRTRSNSREKEKESKHSSIKERHKAFETVKESTETESTPKVRSYSDRNEKVESDNKVKFRTFSDKSDQDPEKRSSFFEFGTVYTKKEKDITKKDDKKQVEGKISKESDYKNENETTLSEKDSESGRESVDSFSRIRRRLPSLEDVLGTNGEKDKIKKEATPEKILESDINKMSAEEIYKGKIDKAKSRFIEADKVGGQFDSSRFELGTVYTGKKTEKVQEKARSIIPTIHSFIKKPEDETSSGIDGTEKSRQMLLGLDGERNKETPYKSQTTMILNTKNDKTAHKTDRDQSGVHQTQISATKISKIPAKDEKVEHLSQKVEKDSSAAKPPSSPRSDRKKMAEQRFGKVSYRAGEQPFEFGTVYKKKEDDTHVKLTTEPKQEITDSKQQIADSKQKIVDSKQQTSFKAEAKPSQTVSDESIVNEKQVKQVEDSSKEFDKFKEVKESKLSAFEKSKIAKVEAMSKVFAQESQIAPFGADFAAHHGAPKASVVTPIKIQTEEKKDGRGRRSVEKQLSEEKRSPVRTKSDSQFQFDIKAQTVSTAAGKSVEVPTSPRKQSPIRVSVDSFKSVSSDHKATKEAVSPREIKGIQIENIKSTKTERKELKSDFMKQKESVSKPSVTSVEIKSPDTVKEQKTPDSKQTMQHSSFSSLEIKSPTTTIPVVESVKKDTQTGSSATTTTTQFTFDQKAPASDTATASAKPGFGADSAPAKAPYSHVDLSNIKDKHTAEMLKEMEEQKRVQDESDFLKKIETMKEKLSVNAPKKIEIEEKGKKLERSRSIKAKIEKAKFEKPVMTKIRVDKMLVDTSLDDILDRNVEYLSDMEPPEFTRGRTNEKKPRPQSIHEHQKTKRSFKKKVSTRRSKSEDRSHFKVIHSDEDSEVIRSKAKEDMKRSKEDLRKSQEDLGKASVKVTEPRSDNKPAAPEPSKVDATVYDVKLGAGDSSVTPTNTRLLSHRFESSQTSGDKPVTQSSEISRTGSFKISTESSVKKRSENENQPAVSYGVQKPAPCMSEMLYGEQIKNQANESVSQSSLDFTSGMASDTSEISERRRPIGQAAFESRDSETSRLTTTDSDVSVSSAMSEGSRKRRKDKSSLRKSKLNESGEDVATPIRRRDSAEESSRNSRIGVRRVASSRTARESREDKYKDANKDEVLAALKKHNIDTPLSQRTTSQTAKDLDQSSDKHANDTDLKHLNNLDSPRIKNRSVLDSHSVLPSRFALPSKVSSVISKLSEASDRSSKENSPLRKTDDPKSARSIKRGNNFSQLLQKFSSSEASGSEKSDTDTHSPRGRKILLKRQEAYAVSSASSDDTRRTPERTQSLRIRGTPATINEQESGISVQRSSSFRSDFMKRRYSPEPDNRRRLPETPKEQSDKPSPELAKVLSRRSEIVTKQQNEGEVTERERIHDGKVAKADTPSAASVDEVISDSEVLKMLQSRRKETDSSVEYSSVSESEKKCEKEASHQVGSALNTNLKSTQIMSQVSSGIAMATEPSITKPRTASQSSVESKASINISAISTARKDSPALHPTEQAESDKLKSDALKIETKAQVPKLDLSSIDTSLAILETVTDNMESIQEEVKHSRSQKGVKVRQALSSVNVAAPNEVVQFIKAVESDIGKTDPKLTAKSDTKLSMDIVKTEKERDAITDNVQSIAESQEFRRASSPTSPGAGTIDITSKMEIMRKISTKDRTPERQTAKKVGPMKVTSSFISSPGSGLKRTESVGRTESERPKGILKRTPSLKQTGVIVDPELANVLKSRRQRHDDVAEEEDEDKEKAKLTAEEEIRQARETHQNEAASQEREVSVAERVFQMYNKIEEVKSCPITPRARSGPTTPKSFLQERACNISPKNQPGFEEGTEPSALSGTQLIERLTSLEGQQSNLSEKRKQFQKRKRDDFRTRTQPVTLQEIQIADGLETVRKFRSEVIQQSSVNIFESLQKQEAVAPIKKTEFPQQLPCEKRGRGQRHKTLPVTAAELSAVPEGQVIDTMNSLKKKFESFGARDSKADSGILSGSDGENLERDAECWRTLSQEESIEENDPIKMSVSAKASMFVQIQESLKEKSDKRSASGAKRYIDRKKRERSRTLPITEDEVKLAAEIADNEEKENAKQKELNGTGSVLPTEAAEGDTPDELTSQSLKDKVKLFTTIEEEKKAAAKKKGLPPPPKRRNRKLASRFSTQPITYEEVEKAAKISPLACSLVKPPDPDILSGLSVKDQRELMTKHAQQTLSQPGSRTGSRTPSRATSVSDLREGIVNEDALTNTNTDLNQSNYLIDTGAASDSVRPSDVRTKGFSIIKQEEHKSSHTVEKISSELDSKKKSILKSELEQKLSLGLFKPNTDAVPTMSDIKSVLKKDSSLEKSQSSEVKSILKKEGSFETKKLEPERSVIKNVSDSMYKDVLHEMSKSIKSEAMEDDQAGGEGMSSSGDNLDSDEGLLDGGDGSGDTPVRRRDKKTKRRFNRDRASETERYRTQPAEVTPETPESAIKQKKRYGVARHLTQPVTPDEKKEAEIATEMPEIQKTGSINDRLNALKKNGEEQWKKRVSSPTDLDRLERRSMSPPVVTPDVKMREKRNLDMPRPSSIADRLTLLDSAQGGWRERVGETDVKKFTLEHKISSSGQTVGESPLVSRLRARKELSRGDSESSENSEIGSPTSPTKESSKFPPPKEVICTDIPIEMLQEDSKSSFTPIMAVEEETQAPTNVEVPNAGGELDLFFKKSQSEKLPAKTPELDVSVDDFNELFLTANDMLETTKKIKPKRRHNPKSRNPLKTMSACIEVKSEYTEVNTGVAERELKRVKTSAISQNSGFAVEALAGLASKENFSKIELRKTDSNGAGSPAGNTRLEPYLPLMLIHIKGRRRVQCRMVEPKAESINSGDCYVLITHDKLIQWHGNYCNVIEKAKAADFSEFVKQKRDMGCKKSGDIIIVEETQGKRGGGRHFWNLLGGHKPYMACGPAEEDELYENHVVETNMIYALESNKLVPCKEYWGQQPKYEMLKKDKIFVFDFGSELYLWQGKAASPTQRKISLKLAQQLWSNGYDYTSCDINPVSPLRGEEDGGLPSENDTRPDWALFGKVNQNMETILFREKFADWPDTSRLIQVKSQEDVSAPKFDLADLKAYDAKLMVPTNTAPVSMVLEGSHVGRGNKWEQDMDGFIQEQTVKTLKVRVWHVLEYDHFEIEDHSYGQFHEGDTYVVRWQYMIINAGMKNLKGQASRFSNLGRERCAYFFWQGKSSTINEKGASALMTVELDEERGPQVRVDEGKEPACFLNLFKGCMITHIGKREEEETNSEGPWKFYCLRNEYENEMCLIEVEKDISNLRSVSSLLMLNVEKGQLIIWHGCKSPEHTKKLIMKAAEFLKKKCPLEVGLKKGVQIDITEVAEGKERTDFWRIMNVSPRDRSLYHSLLDNPESFSHTLRLFHMTSVSGIFEAQEVLNPSRTPELPTKFPVLQNDLYKASQPAVFLIDNGHEVYLWQGWWPEGDEDQENVHTGSAQTRFTIDRKCAMETTIQYCKEINPDSPPPAYLVYAGLEPLSFTNLFPFWIVDDNVREINMRDGKTEGELVPVQDLLKKLTKTRYTFSELMEIPLPEGVDPLKLESYLSDEEFEGVLDMTRDDFYALPGWKQTKAKQQVGLF